MRIRTEHAFTRRARPALLLCCLAFLAATRAPAQCSSDPRYEVDQVWEDSASSVFIAVSIRLNDFAPPRLICLAQAFKRRYHGRKSVDVLIFSSPDAAKRYLGRPPDYAPAKTAKQRKLQSLSFWLSQLHGYYSYDADKHQEYLEIRPFGSDAAGPNDTKISLPVSGALPHCHLEISGRCMLALEDIAYPEEALTNGLSGDVTIAGTIARDGRITSIRVVQENVTPSEQKNVLVNEAMRNVRTWRFEASSRQEPIRLTYSYVIDPTLPIPPSYRNQVDVQFALPNQITIRGRHLK